MERRRETDSQDLSRRGFYSINHRLGARVTRCFKVCAKPHIIALVVLFFICLVALIIIWFVVFTTDEQADPTPTPPQHTGFRALGNDTLNTTDGPFHLRNFEAFTSNDSSVKSTNHSPEMESTIYYPTNGRFSMDDFSLNGDSTEEQPRHFQRNSRKRGNSVKHRKQQEKVVGTFYITQEKK